MLQFASEMDFWKILGWIVWVAVFLLGISVTIKVPNDRTEEVDEALLKMGAQGEVERRVLGWVLGAGCLITLIYPISKLHLIWWPFAAWGIWLAMIAVGPRLLVGLVLALWLIRLWDLGMEAWPGNLRLGALFVIGVGAASATLGPTRSFGARTRGGGVALILLGAVAFVILQFS